MAELEEFRKQWEKELSHSNRRKSSVQLGTSSLDTTSTTKHTHELGVEPEEKSTVQSKNVLLESLVDNDSNSTENYQPFVIVDNLLKDGCSPTSNRKCTNPENIKHSVSPSSSYFSDKISKHETRKSEESDHTTKGKKRGTPQTYSQLHVEKKRRLVEERLLDKLISDLDEITEIPFFDIDLPRELALKIFQHLHMKDLCSCCQVSKAWRSLAEDELLWYRICVGLGEHQRVSEGGNWKSHAQFCITRVHTLTTNWKSRVGKLEQLQYIKGGILCHVSSHQDRLVAGYTNGQVKMWELGTGAECVFQPSSTSLCIDEGQEEGTLPNLLVCTATSERLTAAAYSQGIVDVWHNEGVTYPVHTISCPQSVTSVCLAPKQPLILSAYGPYVRADFSPGCGEFQQLQILDLNTQVKHMGLLRCPDSNHSVQYKAVMCTGNVVWCHRPGQSQERMTELHNMIDAPITALDVDEGRSQLVIGVSVYGGPLHSCKVKLYCLNTGRVVTTLKGHTYFISCINLGQSPPHCLITGCGDRKVRVYDVRCPSPALTLARHTQTVTQVQMDHWKLVSGGEDGLTCVWDQRMVLKLWDWHNRHPVRYSQFSDHRLIVANIPVEKFPQKDEFESVLHKRYRGSIQMYDFLSDQSTQGIPENCLSSYDTAEGYDYNIRLTMPYDNL